MKRSISSADLDLLNKGLAPAKIILSPTWHPECKEAINCCFIDNADGTLRWLWPAAGRNTAFLKFYHTGSPRARILHAILKMAIMIGFGRFVVSGYCTLYINKAAGRFNRNHRNWALFTGTVGETRKLVCRFQHQTKGYFVKMPVTDYAATTVLNEVVALMQPTITGMEKPLLLSLHPVLALQSDLYQNKAWKVPASVNDLPLNAFQTWLQHKAKLQPLQANHWWRSARTKVEGLTKNATRYSPILIERLKALMASFENDQQVTTAAAHGDFTPWNIRYRKNTIGAIDWELYNENRPAFYDLFHFVYQESILIQHHDFNVIRTKLDKLLAQPQWRQLIGKMNLDIAIAEQLYLLHTITYYLDLYSRQDKWHLQIDWLLQVWCEALGYWLEQKKQFSAGEIILEDLVHYLRNTNYAALKFECESIRELPAASDLDVCMNRTDAKQLTQWLAHHTQVLSCQRKHFSYMDRITLVLRNNSFLHIDCMWQMKRKRMVFLSLDEMLRNTATLASGIKIPDALMEVKYIWLFHLLNRAEVPAARKTVLLSKPKVNEAIQTLTKKYHLIDRNSAMFDYNSQTHLKVMNQLQQEYPANKGFGYLKNSISYLLDCMAQLKPQKGYMITFSGVDGAGKSTVITRVAKNIEKELRMPVVVLRHRPSILPILSAWKYGRQGAEEISMQSLPRNGSGKAGVTSLLRFAYYYTDYLLGQFYIQLRYVYRGYAVLYDRYYFDFINDSKRSNIIIPTWLSYGLYRFLLKPHFNYFLFAPADIILKRKQELDAATIEMLTDKYLQLFTTLGKNSRQVYRSVSNLDLDTTTNHIFDTIKSQKLCAVL